MNFPEMFCISIKISLNFVPRGPIENKSTLVQVMAWCQTGTKPLPELMLTMLTPYGIIIQLHVKSAMISYKHVYS